MLTEADFISAYCITGKDRAPARVGSRVLTNGRFGPEAGNTIIRHVPEDSRSMAVLTDVQEALKTTPWGRQFAFLPTASFHMTLSEGVIDSKRVQHFWPEGVDYSAPVEQTTALYQQRLASFQSPGPFNMRLKGITPNGLRLEGATPDDERMARHWRDVLCSILGYRKPDHETYGFHLTMAYQISWLPEEAAPHYLALLQRLAETITAELPVIELNPPALCRFASITHFEELVRL